MTSTVYIAKNVYGGDGLGRLGDGRVVFVPGAWAGEQVKAEISEEHKNFVRARLVEVVEASPSRTGEGEPPVPGMVYANLEYRAEMDAKESQLKEALERARLQPESSFGRMRCEERPLNYRNKVTYHLEQKRDGSWAVGYRREPEHEVVDVADDPLAVPEINAKLPEIRRHITALLTQGAEAVRRETARRGSVTVRWTAKSGVKWWTGPAPQDVALRETTCGRVFEVPAGGFYQVNPAAGDALVRTVRDEYERHVDSAPDVLDLYCGVGVFGICCATGRKGAGLTGIESGRQAVEFAKRNAVANGVEARFFAEQVGRNMRRIRIDGRTTVILDPPRGGLERNVPECLAASNAPRILYVSCDPATLVRDLRVLCRAYSLESVRWVDMFPRTARFETLAVMTKAVK